MKKSVRLFSPLLLLLIIILNACSISDAPPDIETTAPTPASASASSTASFDVETDYACMKQTRIISGIVDSVTARTMTITSSDGRSRSFACGLELIQNQKDELIPGSLVTIEYCGLLDNGENVQLAVVVAITAVASPEETIMMRAGKLLETMTLSEKVGQMFLAHYPASDAPERTRQYQPGGYILFSNDFRDKTPEDVLAAVQSCQQNAGIPMLIGVDEEGGTVNRISRYQQFRPEPFLSPQSLYTNGGWDAIVSDTLEKTALLKSLGINLNLAPVCDVSADPSDFIYKRAFGTDAALTAEYVKTVVETINGEQFGCVLKHFPGYGGNADTHTGSSYDERPYETFTASDFIPFQAGIEAGAGAVMFSHNIVACMDDEAPASLSAEVHRVLREELGFDGVVITDDVNMKAVLDFAADENAAVIAVLAGNDMVITPHYEEQIPAVIAAVESGMITEERIDESVLRILAWKLRLGIIN